LLAEKPLKGDDNDAAVAGAILLSVTAANAVTRKYETYREDPPAVSGPIVSDCTIVGQYHDKPYCFGNSYQGYATARANLGGRGAY
jgi:hypothetical protein